jgi:purine-binding chemotaxis protein CheW
MAEMATIEHATDLFADSDQFLTFTIQGEEYGIEILRVQEIKGLSKIRPIPNAPHYVKGVMNLRGTVVPILDLRSRFGIDEADYNQFTVIIMVSVGGKMFGLVVDSVSDVLNIGKEQIEETPDVGGGVDTSFFRGMGKVGEKLVLLLNIDKLLCGEKWESVEQTVAQKN